MNRLMLMAMAAAALAVPTAAATAASNPTAMNAVNIAVPNGSLHYDKKTLFAKPGVVRITFSNGSAAPHNVSLEHNGEFEYGATLTIRKGITTTFLTLAKGTYHVYSSVGKDEDKGMSATLIVK